MRITTAALIAALGASLALTACQTPTPYQPLAPGAASDGGFTDQRIEADRYRVTFQGNTLTSRDTVETYLLYRAAELTVAQGYDWFEMADRHTGSSEHTYVNPDTFYWSGAYAGGYWRPSWRLYSRARGLGGGLGWRAADPFWGDPFWSDDLDVQTVQKFEASAEIVMHHGAKPEGDSRALDAHAVIANLGPKVQRPN